MSQPKMRQKSVEDKVLLAADFGRVGEGASLNQPQCPSTTYGGNNYVQGKLIHSSNSFQSQSHLYMSMLLRSQGTRLLVYGRAHTETCEAEYLWSAGMW